MVQIIDETGEPTTAELRQHGRHTVAIVEGRILIPGSYTILSEEGAGAVQRAEDRAQKAANFRLISESERI